MARRRKMDGRRETRWVSSTCEVASELNDNFSDSLLMPDEVEVRLLLLYPAPFFSSKGYCIAGRPNQSKALAD